VTYGTYQAATENQKPGNARRVTREVAPLAAGIGMYGLVTAFQAPTMSLFLADDVHTGPLATGLFFVARGAASIIVSQATGRLADRLADRRKLLALSGAAGVASAVCFALIRSYAVLLVVGVPLLAASVVAFSQMFAYAKEYATVRARPVTSFLTSIRSFFSAAWVVGPPLGLFIVARWGFMPLFLACAGLSLGIAVIGCWGLSFNPSANSHKGTARHGLTKVPAHLWLLLGVIAMLGTANQMYGIDVALFVTHARHLSPQLVGWMAGLAAGLEVPIMLLAGRVADRVGKGRLVLAAAVIATAFFCLLPLASSPAVLLGLQVLNATWGAVVLSIPMIMVQEQVPSGAGAATSMYNSAFTSASLVSGALAGVVASEAGYSGVFWACAALSAVSVAFMLAGSVLGRPSPRS
jgi:SET family sugar efflux transporter-like MFS transporter